VHVGIIRIVKTAALFGILWNLAELQRSSVILAERLPVFVELAAVPVRVIVRCHALVQGFAIRTKRLPSFGEARIRKRGIGAWVEHLGSEKK